MFSINLDPRVLSIREDFPNIPSAGLGDFLEAVASYLPSSFLVKSQALITCDQRMSADDLMVTDIFSYIRNLDYVLDSIETALNGDLQGNEKRVAQIYFVVFKIRERLVEDAWSIAGTNRVQNSSLRYNFMASRATKPGLEKRMRDYLTQ